MPKKSVEDQSYELIKSYCLDPDAEHTGLGEEQKKVLDRWISAARVLDRYPIKRHAVAIHMAKYPEISQAKAYQDIAKAIELFNSLHTFDYDWWHSWLLKDIIEHIEASKKEGDLRSWAEGHKNLIKAIGERPEVPIDPKLTEKNTFIIPIQINNKIVNINWESFMKIPEHIRREITSQQSQEIGEEEADKILES